MTPFCVSRWANVVDNICQILTFVTWPLLVSKFASAYPVYIRFHWTIVSSDIARTGFSIWRPSAISIYRILIICHDIILGIKICTLKLDDHQLWYSDKIIFKLSAIHDLEFSKFGICHMTCVQTWFCCFIPNFALIRQLIAEIEQKDDFRYGGRPPSFEFAIFCLFVMWQLLKPKFVSVHQISSKLDDPRLRYCDKTIFRMAAVRHLEFLKFGILQ